MPNSNEYMREYMIRRWHKRRNDAIEQLGGKCINCGSSENLEFDHIDADLKSFPLSKFSSASKIKWQEELNKCQLLCHECHMKKSKENRDFCSPKKDLYTCPCGRSFTDMHAIGGHRKYCKV